MAETHDAKMSFMEHLGELRVRIVRALYALLAGAAIALSGFLRKPQLTGSTGKKISGNSRAGLSALFPG